MQPWGKVLEKVIAHRKGSTRDANRGAPGKVLSESVLLHRCAHQDHFQVRPLVQQLTHGDEHEVSYLVTLMQLVEDQVCHTGQGRLCEESPSEYTRGTEKQPGALARTIVQVNRVADKLTHFLATLLRHSVRKTQCRKSPGLSDDDVAHLVCRLKEKLWDLCRLSTSSGTLNDDHAVRCNSTQHLFSQCPCGQALPCRKKFCLRGSSTELECISRFGHPMCSVPEHASPSQQVLHLGRANCKQKSAATQSLQVATLGSMTYQRMVEGAPCLGRQSQARGTPCLAVAPSDKASSLRLSKVLRDSDPAVITLALRDVSEAKLLGDVVDILPLLCRQAIREGRGSIVVR
mmetsp:Transcript_117708/g.375151  ORF Transcript_117708/g.375151 Transcript_117708/m.375151 type:complete len:346 (-) Transcript_117708:119-1156(-)